MTMKATLTEFGWAYLTPTTQLFLDQCPAVIRWASDGRDSVAVFEYDPLAEIWGHPAGVFFSLDEAPDTAIEVAEKLK
jgi:hypothetical protein